MSVTMVAHHEYTIWNFFETSADGPNWSSIAIGSSSTSARIVCDFQFEGQSVNFVLTGMFPENPSGFLLLGALTNQAGVSVTGYEISLSGAMMESATMTQGVSLSLLLSAVNGANRTTLAEYYAENDTFIGSKSSQSGNEGDDGVNGYAGNDTFIGYATSVSNTNSDKFYGGDGIDTLVLQGKRAEYSISSMMNVWMPDNLEGDGRRITDNVSGRDGVKTERYVERLEFSDKKIALDLDGNAGKALEFIGMMAHNLVNVPAVVGTILSIFDQGKSMKEVCQLAIDVGLTRDLAGSTSNLDLAKLAFRNVVGSEASTETANVLAGYIQGSGGSMSQADFLATVAQLDLNNQHIGLVGLQSTGVEYIV